MLTRTQGKKFEGMFLVKIASKGTSLNMKLSRCFTLRKKHNFQVSTRTSQESVNVEAELSFCLVS